jgi:CRISPR/Cas system CMR-associated protein Cmr1 (group 7 of RAMP superfamily)
MERKYPEGVQLISNEDRKKGVVCKIKGLSHDLKMRIHYQTERKKEMSETINDYEYIVKNLITKEYITIDNAKTFIDILGYLNDFDVANQ